jgi:hypothetical protein
MVPGKRRESMKSNIRDIGETRIIELGGKITIGTGDVKIRELISQALEDDKKDVLVRYRRNGGLLHHSHETRRAAQAHASVAEDQRHSSSHAIDHGLRSV